jgi:alpha-tubulin suppressor-like RCC1 family protein
MPVTGTITTNFIDENGLDLGKILIEKDYVMQVYPNLIPGVKTPSLYVWGINTYGQIGDNTVTSRSSPVETVAGVNTWNVASASYFSTAAVKSDGTLWLWGSASNGSLGTNDTTHRSSPIQTVTSGSTWMQVSGGKEHFAAVKTDGTLWCWGLSTKGQLGDNANSTRSSPVQTVTFATNWKSCACGYTHTAGIKTDGTLWLWGLNNNGQLGTNTTTTFASGISSPVQTVTFATNWAQVSCGYTHTAGIKTDGTLWCWGDNGNGQLGDNTIVKKSSPVQTVAGGTNWRFVACGNYFSAATKTDGTLWCWGKNNNSQLGDNTSTHRSSPLQTIAFGTNWNYVYAKADQCGATKTDGTLWNWGYNNNGQIGDNTVTSRGSPVQTALFGKTWKSLAFGLYNCVAIQDGDY